MLYLYVRNCQNGYDIYAIRDIHKLYRASFARTRIIYVSNHLYYIFPRETAIN